MKSTTNRLFYSFVLLVGSILAVLALVIGQLFPFFVDSYVTTSTEGAQIQLDQLLDDQQLNLTSEEQEKVLESFLLTKNEELFHSIKKRLIIAISVISFVAFALISMIGYKIIQNLIEPIENVTGTARELAKGNYRARAYANGPKIVVELRNSINILARNLQDITKTRKIEEERLKTLIENMGSALMMIDREGQVSIVNRKFLQHFELAFDEVKDRSFLTLGLPVQLEEFIDHVFLTEMPYRQQLEVEIQGEIHYEQAYGAPVMGEHGRWLGVVIVMHDVSELIRLEQVRKDFVANVSHELRTPITSIKGFAETLLDGALKDEQMLLSFLEIIHEESNRLQMLVNDLLDLSKMERHGFTLDVMPTKLQEVIARTIELTSAQMEEKNMQFDVAIEKDVYVLGDANRLIQVFTNLINNAAAYSKEDTTITLRVYEEGAYGIVEVDDQGIGIEKNEISRVFERFYRVDRARSRNSGGTGLGLSIVKHLIEAHHGKIQVTSEVGVGTCMKVMLPLKKQS